MVKMQQTGRQKKIFQIFRSSAGSGKTWQLAYHYVLYALKSPGNYRHILAVTFTNKATAEMKDRILVFLNKLCEGSDPVMAQHFREDLNIDEATLRRKARSTLEEIIHNYGRFSVSTIDAFFQGIIRSFAKETGMLGNYQVEMRIDRVRDEVVDMTLADAGVDEELTYWLVDYASTKVDTGEAWDIRNNLIGLSYELFTERFRRIQHLVIQNADSGQSVYDLYKDLLKHKRTYEHRLKRMAEQALHMIRDAGLRPEDFKYGKNGPGGFFEKIIVDPDRRVGSHVRNAAESMDAWIRKGDDVETVRRVLERGLYALLQDVVQYMDRNATMYRSVAYFLRYMHSYALLTEILKRLDRYRTDHGVMLISDVNAFLRGIVRENDAPFIYEKTGNTYRHFLIDEFQDTSVFQWENFRPLIENSIAQGRENLVVGDGKQSIYRWRSGEWELLQHELPVRFRKESTAVRTLDSNYRSARDIIAFNNRLFSRLPDALRMLLMARAGTDGASEDEARQVQALGDAFQGLYRDARQSVGGDEVRPGGLVEISFRESQGSVDERRDVALQSLRERLDALLGKGYRPADVAVLVRNKEEGKNVVQYLIRRGGRETGPRYDVVSNESLYLGYSKAVRIVINGLRCIANPADMLARANLRYEYSMLEAGDKQDAGALFGSFSGSQSDDFRQDFTTAMQDVQERGVNGQIEHIIRFFNLDKDATSAAYLMGLQDAVYDFLEDNPGGSADFFKWWEEEGRYHSVQMPEGLDAVQVITIHKAKGLEFPVVMIPFCNWSLDHSPHHENFIWTSDDRAPFDRAGYFPLRYSGKLAQTIFRKEYLQELGKVYIDNLNLLYVALTRAEKALYVDCTLPDLRKFSVEKLRNVSDLLYYFHATERDELAGKQNWTGPVLVKDDLVRIGALPPPPEGRGLAAISRFDHYRTYPLADRIRVRRQSDDLFGTDWKARIDYGILVHKALSVITTREDVDGVLRRFHAEGLMTLEDRANLRRMLENIFELPEMRSWFSGSWKVYAEMPILTPEGRQWKPDRVQFDGERTLVIDFKTGGEDEAHQRQVRRYMHLLRQMGYVNVEGYLLYISNQNIVRVA